MPGREGSVQETYDTTQSEQAEPGAEPAESRGVAVTGWVFRDIKTQGREAGSRVQRPPMYQGLGEVVLNIASIPGFALIPHRV